MRTPTERLGEPPRPDPSLDPLLRLLYRLLGWTFAIVGALFFLAPDGTIAVLNAVGSWFGFPPAPWITHRFWLSLGVAYMAVVTALAFLIAPAPSERRLLMLPLAIGKATSSLTCLWFFLVHAGYFVYLANFLVDASLALLAALTFVATAPAPPAFPGRARRTLEAIAEALFPPGTSARRVDVTTAVNEVEAQLRSFGPSVMRGFSLLLGFIDWNPRLFHGRAQRLSELSWQERVPILEAMEESRILLRRQAVHMVKLLLGLNAYRQPAVRSALLGDDPYLQDKLAEALGRRERGEKGPYPQPVRFS